ncbi:hypothetical protein ACWEQU_30370 [Streptomyces nodosus]
MSTSPPRPAERDGLTTTGPASPRRDPAPDQAPPSRIRSLLDLVGLGFFPLAFMSRLPFAMTVVGTLTLVSDVRGSVAAAGRFRRRGRRRTGPETKRPGDERVRRR